MQFRITYADGTESEVAVTAADLVHFERKFGVSAQSISRDSPLEHVLFLAWNVERRTKATALPFDEWLDLGVDVPEDKLTDADPKAPPANRATRRSQPTRKKS